ncbi:DDX21 [Bugula neritina]|uniref:DDX21 n=1 Tax=Bugula neritina TaxID=10212 RepID=A0A7J7KSB1_BUGNE|nr:DDX21 [Bugula neritina]
MKLPAADYTEENKQDVKVKTPKSKKVKGEKKVNSDVVQEALKKPRTRSVSLTLSDNGIEDSLTKAYVSPDKAVKKKKVKKTEKSEDQSVENGKEAVDEIPSEHKEGQFSNFPIRAKTIEKLQARGIKYLFPVQVKTFQKVLEGKDVIAKARTGTGKTLAFALPLVEKLETELPQKHRGRPPRVIVLAPTRELVNQVCKDFKSLTSSTLLSIHAFYGGVPFHPQEQALRNGIDILIGTPGRVLDWVNKNKLNTGQLQHVVLDEVDQMLDMGFADDVEQIISHSYQKGDADKQPQTLFFSATLPDWVKKTAAKYMQTMPPVIDLVGNSVNQTAKNVKHLAIRSYYSNRASDISRIIQFYSGESGRVMVFCETKKDVDELAMCPDIKQNKEKLHGDVKQAARESVLAQFRAGSVKVLITTNVAARGLDIKEVDVVIQTNPPTDIESYIHRSGRTGRAGKSGISICLYNPRNEGDLFRVERAARISFERVNLPSHDQLASRGIKEIISSMGQIDGEIIDKFRETAEELISARGPVETAAMLIAIATGNTKVKHQSLINSREGFVTYLYTTTATMRFKGYVYNVLNNRCPDISGSINSLTLTNDMKGAAFDLSQEDSAKYEASLLFEGKSDSIVKAKELPQLKSYVPPTGYAPSKGPRANGYGGFKRSFQRDNYYQPQNKKTKFD